MGASKRDRRCPMSTITNRVLFAICFAVFGLVILLPTAATATTAAPAGEFAKLPGEQGNTSPLLLRVVKYDGSTNGAITVDIKNPTDKAQEFSAKGIYFVPTGNPNEAPQRLGAVGPFQLQSSNSVSQRMDRTPIGAGGARRLSPLGA